MEIHKEVIESLQTLSQLLERNITDEHTSYLERCKNGAVTLYNYYWNRAPTAVKCKPIVDQFLISKNTEIESLESLLQFTKRTSRAYFQSKNSR